MIKLIMAACVFVHGSIDDPKVKCSAGKTQWFQKEAITELTEPEKVNIGEFCYVELRGNGFGVQVLGSCEALAKALK